MTNNEDDFTHYFNATQRLSTENAQLRQVLAKVREIAESAKGHQSSCLNCAAALQEIRTVLDG